MSDFPYGLDEVGWDRYCEARDEKANDEEEDEMTEPNETPDETPAETGRLYVVLAEQLPYDSVRAVWETVLRAVFVSRDAALEAGRERLEREPVEGGGGAAAAGGGATVVLPAADRGGRADGAARVARRPGGSRKRGVTVKISRDDIWRAFEDSEGDIEGVDELALAPGFLALAEREIANDPELSGGAAPPVIAAALYRGFYMGVVAARQEAENG